MKKKRMVWRRGFSLCLALLLCLSLLPAEVFAADTATGVAINETNFPNDIFREQFVKTYDTDSDNFLSADEIAAVTQIVCNSRSGIDELTVIEYFTALTRLECYYDKLTSLDLSANKELTYLSCSHNSLTSLDLSANTKLTYLNCNDNSLTSLDLSRNTALTELSCRENQLTSLDVSSHTGLTSLCCRSNQLTSLDLSKNTVLTVLECQKNQLTSLDLSKNTALTELYCQWNQLTSLDVSGKSNLQVLQCDNNQLTSLDLSGNSSLNADRLSIGDNKSAIGVATDYTFDLADLPGFEVSKANGWKNAGVSGSILTVTDPKQNVT